MSGMIIYEKNDRKELSSLKNENDFSAFEDRLYIALGECSLIIGKRLKDEDQLTTTTILSQYIRQNYPNYTTEEIVSILKNGFISDGENYGNISASSCADILKKHFENQFNRDKLHEARSSQKEEVQDSKMSEEHDFKVRCYRSFKIAKLDYENDKVTDFKINFDYHTAYYHVLNEVDKSINQTNEVRQKLWVDIKKYISECRDKEAICSIDNFIKLLFEFRTEQELAENALRGRLFHLWAINNFFK